MKNIYKKTVNKDRNTSDVSKASMWYLICNVLQKAITLLTVPIITRMLTTAEYGRYCVINSWANIVFLFATLSICDEGYMVGMKKYYKDKDCYTSSVYSVAFLISTVSLVIGWSTKGFLYRNFGIDRFALIIIFMYVYGQFGISLWYQRSRYDFKYWNVVGLTLIISVSTPCLEIILIRIAKSKNIPGDVGANLGYAIPLIIIGAAVISILLFKGRTFYNKEYWKFALSFNIPLIPYYLAQRILHQSDRLMIERLDSVSASGIYSIAYAISGLLSFINNALNSAIVPWKYRKFETKEIEVVSRFTSIEILCVAVLHLMLIAVTPELIIIFAGKAYFSAIYVIPAIVVGIFFNWVAQQFIHIEFYYEKKEYTAVTSCLAAVLNLFLNWLFIPRYGFQAAGYTTFVCYMLYLGIHIIISRYTLRQLHEQYSYELKTLSLILSGSIIGTIIIVCLYGRILIRYALLIAVFPIMFIFIKTLCKKK